MKTSRLRDPRTWPLVIVALAFVLSFIPATRADELRALDDKLANEHHRKRIGLVFDVGGRGDKSFNDAAYAGLLKAQAKLPIDASYMEPTGSEDRESALRLFAAQGFDLVIGTGFIFSSDVEAVARDYPNVHFACIDYFPGKNGAPNNIAGLSFKEEEGSFLVGAVAGLMTKTKHVGFVGGMTGPLIRKFEAGYDAGVHQVCPECEVRSSYAGDTPDAYRDPAKGQAIAIAEIAAGADVLYHASGATGHGVFEAAKDAHVLAIGVDSDQYDEMPGTVVTSMVKRVDVAVYDVINDVVEGHFRSGPQVFGLKRGGVDYVHLGPHAKDLPPNVVKEVDALRERIISGEIAVPSH